MKPSFNDALARDKVLFNLATYDAFDGNMPVPKSLEEMAGLQTKAIHRFNYFKQLVKDGETTIEQLEDMVASRCGAFPKRKFNSQEEAIQNVLDESSRPVVEENADLEKLTPFFKALLSGIMEDSKIPGSPNKPISSFKIIPVGELPPDVSDNSDIPMEKQEKQEKPQNPNPNPREKKDRKKDK